MSSRITSTITACAVIAGGLAVLSGTSAPQQTTFKAGTRTVPVYATVLDPDGRLVPELTESDFEVYDNGKKQTLTIFDNQAVPFSAVLVLDTSASMTMNIDFVQEAAVQFVIRMLPVDKGVVGFFNSKIQFSPGLTDDRDSLVRYIRNNMEYGNSTVLWDAVDSAMNQLADTPGRRVVVALTDGDDQGSRLTAGDVRDRAQNDDVMVYAIGIESNYHNGQQWVRTRPGGSFKRLAAETGGGYFELKKTAELNSTFTRVIEELHSQYALGFTPQALDGKTHKLEVKLTKSGLKARARQSYLAK